MKKFLVTLIFTLAFLFLIPDQDVFAFTSYSSSGYTYYRVDRMSNFSNYYIPFDTSNFNTSSYSNGFFFGFTDGSSYYLIKTPYSDASVVLFEDSYYFGFPSNYGSTVEVYKYSSSGNSISTYYTNRFIYPNTYFYYGPIYPSSFSFISDSPPITSSDIGFLSSFSYVFSGSDTVFSWSSFTSTGLDFDGVVISKTCTYEKPRQFESYDGKRISASSGVIDIGDVTSYSMDSGNVTILSSAMSNSLDHLKLSVSNNSGVTASADLTFLNNLIYGVTDVVSGFYACPYKVVNGSKIYGYWHKATWAGNQFTTSFSDSDVPLTDDVYTDSSVTYKFVTNEGSYFYNGGKTYYLTQGSDTPVIYQGDQVSNITYEGDNITYVYNTDTSSPVSSDNLFDDISFGSIKDFIVSLFNTVRLLISRLFAIVGFLPSWATGTASACIIALVVIGILRFINPFK